MLTARTCLDCGKTFQGGPLGRFCQACRKRHVGASAKKRGLCRIGANARWGQKQDAGDPPEWIGPSAELMPKEGN